ncbi:MAG: hypothetical protein ACRETB_09670 [Steroidobacteraceae bacterium]
MQGLCGQVFLLWVALIWLGIIVGFGRQIAAQVETHQSAPPLIVFVHAAVFVGWLVLLTMQVLLIRSRRVDMHRSSAPPAWCRRLHPAYIEGVAYITVLQLVAVAFMVDPLWKTWKPAAIRLLGH